MPERGNPLDFFDNRPNVGGEKILGPKMLGPLFLDRTHGVVFEDETVPGNFYRLVVRSGNLQIEQVTL